MDLRIRRTRLRGEQGGVRASLRIKRCEEAGRLGGGAEIAFGR